MGTIAQDSRVTRANRTVRSLTEQLEPVLAELNKHLASIETLAESPDTPADVAVSRLISRLRRTQHDLQDAADALVTAGLGSPSRHSSQRTDAAAPVDTPGVVGTDAPLSHSEKWKDARSAAELTHRLDNAVERIRNERTPRPLVIYGQGDYARHRYA